VAARYLRPVMIGRKTAAGDCSLSIGGLNRVSFPDCKQVHAWSKRDVRLEGSGGI
jgi:hypothetical protein